MYWCISIVKAYLVFVCFVGSRCESCLYSCANISNSQQCQVFNCLSEDSFCRLTADGTPECQCPQGTYPRKQCSSQDHCSEAVCADRCENYCSRGAKCWTENDVPKCRCDECSQGDRCETSYCTNCEKGKKSCLALFTLL